MSASGLGDSADQVPVADTTGKGYVARWAGRYATLADEQMLSPVRQADGGQSPGTRERLQKKVAPQPTAKRPFGEIT